MTPSGSISLSGSSSNARAPNRSYHLAAFSSFASMARATPPTSADTAKALFAGRQEQVAANPLALHRAINGQTREAKDRHIIAAKLLGQFRGHAGELDGTGADRVE